MSNDYAPDSELEKLARVAFRDAVATLEPSPALVRRCMPESVLEAAPRSTRRTRISIGIGMAAAMLATVLYVASTKPGDATDVATKDVESGGTATPWTRNLGPEWEGLINPPGEWSTAAFVGDELVVWAADSTGGGHISQTSGWALDPTGTSWVPIPSDPIGWDTGVTAATSDGFALVTVSARRSEPERIDSYSLAVTTFEDDSAAASMRLGIVQGLDSYLTRAPALLATPANSGDLAWALSHDPQSGHLTVVAVSPFGRRNLPAIPRSGLRPLAVGRTPDGNPVLLTQVLDFDRSPSAVIAFQFASGSWQAVGSQDFPEANATWTGDRFVIVSATDTAGAALSLALDEDGMPTWNDDGSPGLLPCESLVDVITGAGAAVAFTPCGGPSLLPSKTRSWTPLPPLEGALVTPLTAFNGTFVGRAEGPRGNRLVAIRP